MRESLGPNVSCSTTIGKLLDILRVEESCILGIFDAIQYSRLSVDKYAARCETIVVQFMEENIFGIYSLQVVVFRDSVWVKIVLVTQVLQVFKSNF